MYTHTHTHFYRNAHTKVAVEWYRKLNQYAIPHLVCLTHGDRLYAECADEEQSERDVAYTKKAIKKQVEVCVYIFSLPSPDMGTSFIIPMHACDTLLVFDRSFKTRL